MNLENMLSERSQSQKIIYDHKKMSKIGKSLEPESRSVETESLGLGEERMGSDC